MQVAIEALSFNRQWIPRAVVQVLTPVVEKARLVAFAIAHESRRQSIGRGQITTEMGCYAGLLLPLFWSSFYLRYASTKGPSRRNCRYHWARFTLMTFSTPNLL